MSKPTDAACVEVDGQRSNSALHEQLVANVNDYDLRLQTKNELLAAGVPAADLDRLIK